MPSVSIFFRFDHFIGKAARPASVISPRCSKSAQRCLFSSVQWLPLRRGDSRCAHRPSGSRLRVESIQPKHNASSTTSRYGMQSVRGIFVRYIVTQHSFAVAWFAMNHSRSCPRSLYSNRSVISISVFAKYLYNGRHRLCARRSRLSCHRLFQLLFGVRAGGQRQYRHNGVEYLFHCLRDFRAKIQKKSDIHKKNT